jgi:NIMA (never in mitosis gene a)-related kinase
MAHIPFNAKPNNVDHDLFMEGTLSRKHPLDTSKLILEKKFSSALRDAILVATRWDPMKRPDPIRLMKVLKDLMKASGFTTHIPEGADDEELPSWATKVHDYHSLKPKDPSQFDQN